MMRKFQNIALAIGSLLILSTASRAQDLPVATGPATNQGFSIPSPLTGGLRYGLTGSENVRIGYYGGQTVYATTLSGDLAYLSENAAKPMSLIYSGGYIFTTGQTATQLIPTSSTFQNLAFTRGWVGRQWAVNVGDTVQYLPQAATNGLSGISGVGNIGLGLPGGPLLGQDVLTRFGQRVNNTVDGSVQRNLTGKLVAQASGDYALQRFVDNSGGLDSDGIDGAGSLSYRIDALSSVGGSYDFSRYTYPGTDFELTSQSVQAQYSRQVNRRLQFRLSGGPMRSTSNITGLGTGSWNVAAGGFLKYTSRSSSLQSRFDRRVRSGSGVVRGAVSTSIDAVYNHDLGRVSSVSAEGGYTQSDSFQTATTPFTIRTVLGAVQGRRALARNFSAFISYSVQKQILDGIVLNANGYSGLNQTIGFGITYSPSLIHLSHK